MSKTDQAGAIVTCKAPAKINLYLHVTGRRADGYHTLDSLIVFADLGDWVAVEDADTLSLGIDGPFAAALRAGMRAEDDNLVLRAARALAESAGRPARAHIRLRKNLPVAAGIGGGSADAAAALKALAELWEIAPDAAGMHGLAASLGADVPVCMAGRPAFVGGIGELIDPAPPLPDAGLLLANPGLPVPTPEVFAGRAGRFGGAARFAEAPADATALANLLAARSNQLTDAAIGVAPVIGRVLETLAALPGARLARMSGSGATCFAIFDDLRAAEAAAGRLRLAEPDWWLAATLLSGG
jgi:4-diphosphocytidyl-2-C-methyl-D-erythritol kinase